MGLRLYQPPVESDIKSKPAVDRGPAQSRSSIRRTRLVADEIRERRRRVLAAADTISGAPASSEFGRRALRDAPNSLVPPHDRALRDATNPMVTPYDRIVTMFGERWGHLHAESNPNPLRDDYNDQSPMLAMAVEPEFLSRNRVNDAAPSINPYLEGYRPGADSERRARYALASARYRARRRGFRDGTISRDEEADRYQPYVRDVSRRRNEQPLATLEATRLDGLGDRNRSLSPEGEHVWDTLLTTLTPDPQPPSVGGSFTSAALASQSTAAASSRTSFTTPDTAEESTFEPPCESGCDNSDTDADEEDEMDHIQLPGVSGLRAARRSYADAVRSNNEDPLELLGGVGGMQRIVLNLARREDIPDEWWAEVGLSRTLSREASGN